jgi:hypothetical protein
MAIMKHPVINLLPVIPGAGLMVVSYVERCILCSGKRCVSVRDVPGGVYLHSSLYLGVVYDT